MYTRILVPLNGSELSERVLPHAQHLAQAFNATVELVYAVAAIEDIPDKVAAEVAKDADAYLQQIADAFPAGLKPKYTVKTGPGRGGYCRAGRDPGGDARCDVDTWLHGSQTLDAWKRRAQGRAACQSPRPADSR